MVENASQAAALLMLSALRFLWQDLSMVTALLLQIFLPAAVCCLIIHFLRRLLMRRIALAFGWRGVLAVSWLGTPVHELSHALFIVATGMKVTKLALFEPNRETGGLGFVRYSFNRRNPLHQIGCFLSSLAPLIGGSAAIYGATFVFLPGFNLGQAADGVPFFQPADVLDGGRAEMVLRQVVDFELAMLRQLLAGLSFSDWRTFAYLYFIFSVAHNMSPSPQDLQGFPRRLAVLLAALLVANAPLLIMGLGEGSFYGEALLPPLVDFMAVVNSLLYLGVLASVTATLVSLPITGLARRLQG